MPQFVKAAACAKVEYIVNKNVMFVSVFVANLRRSATATLLGRTSSVRETFLLTTHHIRSHAKALNSSVLMHTINTYKYRMRLATATTDF